MQMKYFLITVAVVALLIAGVGAWFLVRGTPIPETGREINAPVQDSNYTQTVTPSSGGETVTPTQTAEQKYNDLFVALGASPVLFSPVSSAAESLGDVYALYDEELAEGAALQMATLDLNADGAAEVLVYKDIEGGCGTGGCVLDVYTKSEGAWKLIFTRLVYDKVATLATTTIGFKDLLLSVRGEPGYKTRVIRFAWDGSFYQEQNIIAVWNGTSFDLLR